MCAGDEHIPEETYAYPQRQVHQFLELKEIEMVAKLVSVQQACAILGIGRTKLYSLINDDALQTVRLGRRRLVIEESVVALIDKLIAERGQ